MTNAELVNIVFEEFKAMGLKPYNVEHIDGYFIFSGEKDSVTHFRLKGHGMWKHWKFGLWVNAEYMIDEKNKEAESKDDVPSVIQLFAQYDTQIDKFKPAASALVVNYDAKQVLRYINDEHKRCFYEIRNMIKFMYRHPLIAYAEFCGEYAGYYSGSFIGEFIKYEGDVVFNKIKKNLLIAYWVPYTKIKCWFAAKDKCIKELELYNFSKKHNGWITNNVYEVRYVFTKEATPEQEVEWLNKWWHKNHYGEFGCYEHVINLLGCRKEGKDKVYRYE